MGTSMFIDVLFRWAHILFGIAWIGLLYYFNFVQTEYFKEAEPDAKADATKKLAPRALWWFRWAAAMTLHDVRLNQYIIVGALAGTIMFLNVWLIIWPNQKIVCGIVDGDAGAAGPKALLASRTNTLLSATMLACMVAAAHATGNGAQMIPVVGATTGMLISVAIVLALEMNAVVGRLGPMTSVNGVIHSSLALAVIIMGLLVFL